MNTERELQVLLLGERLREVDWSDPWNQALGTAAGAEWQAFHEWTDRDRELTRGWRKLLIWRLDAGLQALKKANAHGETAMRILTHVR